MKQHYTTPGCEIIYSERVFEEQGAGATFKKLYYTFDADYRSNKLQ